MLPKLLPLKTLFLSQLIAKLSKFFINGAESSKISLFDCLNLFNTINRLIIVFIYFVIIADYFLIFYIIAIFFSYSQKTFFPPYIQYLLFITNGQYILKIKEIMSQTYANLCQNVNRYTLHELSNLKNIKSTTKIRHPSTQDKTSSSLIKVISPFYQKSKCAKKGPCFCAYHRQKKKAEISHNNFKKINNTSKENFVTSSQELKKVRKLNTELGEKKLLSRKHLKTSGQKLKKQISYSMEKYDNIFHKVLCRNQEFQTFLKKNQLYILTGKLPSKMKQEEQSVPDLQFLQNFYENFENGQEDFSQFLNFQRSKNKNKTDMNYNYSRDKKQKRTLHLDKIGQKFDSNEFIKRLKKIIQSLIKGTNKMSFQKMKKLRETFARLLKKQKNQYQESQFLKNEEFLKNFDNFLVQFQSKQQQKYENIDRPRNKSRKMSIKYIKNKRNQQIREGVYKKKTVRLSERVKKEMMDFFLRQKNQQNEDTLGDNKSLLKKISKNKYEIGIDDRMQSENKQIEDEEKELFEKKQQYKNIFKKNYQEKNIRKVNLHIKAQKGISNFMQHDEKEFHQSIEQQNYDQFYNKNSNQNRIKERLQKIKQIHDNFKGEQILDKNFLKMRKHIEKNRKFILKMESKLRQLDLDVFIIEPNDSLIVRKKKIRCLHQILENNGFQKNRRNGFYDEIIQYLDIYKQHCNMILKKDVKHKKMTDEVLSYEELQLQEVTKEKDLTDSLKFINLHENEFSQKERRIQGWISIPQYITNDETRSKLKQIQQRLNRNEIMKKCQIISDDSQDSLIQVELKDKCPVKKIFNCESSHKKRRNTKKLKSFKQKTQKSFQTSEQLKKRFGFDTLIPN